MREWARSVFLLCLVSALGIVLVAGRPLEKRWYRGNTHTHTLWSDGDGPPEWVTDLYKTRGYHFLVLSDHDILSEGEKWVAVGTERRQFPPERLKKLTAQFGEKQVELRERNGRVEMRLKTLSELRRTFEEKGRFLFIQGEEITDNWKKVPIHHNSVNQVNVIRPPGGNTVREVMQNALTLVKAEAARTGKPVLAHLNHPNWKWAVTGDDIAYVLDEKYFELYTGAEECFNDGDAQHPGNEATWDYVLALRLGRLKGEPLYGLATDDAHEYYKDKAPSSPGRGWVMVRSEELSGDAITRALLAGDFYASTGVTLDDVTAERDGVGVKVAAQPGVAYTLRFIGTRVTDKGFGKVGEVLQETKGPAGQYRFRGDELYVRCTVLSDRKHPSPVEKDEHERAWTQPVVVRGRNR